MKRGLYGLKFDVEKPRSPDVENVFKSRIENVFKETFEKSENVFGRSVGEHAVKRSPLQAKAIIKTPSPQASPPSRFESNDDEDVVYMPLRGMSFANESVNCLDEDSTPRKPLKKRPSPTINTKAALDDIIDIFSQPLKSQQELDEQEDSSSDDDSDATSLTSRSFGRQSNIEDPPEEEDIPGPEQPIPD